MLKCSSLWVHDQRRQVFYDLEGFDLGNFAGINTPIHKKHIHQFIKCITIYRTYSTEHALRTQYACIYKTDIALLHKSVHAASTTQLLQTDSNWSH
jgi:maltooligosyltrehalose synthase